MVSEAATTRGRLTAKRQQEQDIRGYSPSSRWYTALNNAISYVELAETSASPKDRFLNAWSAIYNLYMMIHVRGQIENVTLSDWIKEIQAAPQVRSHCEQVRDSFLEAIDKAQNTLLKDAEKKRWRECKELVDIWRDKRRRDQPLSAEKACGYTLLIGRDLRNAVSHPTLNPNATATKRALTEAADLYLPLAIAAIEATIERPPANTTGKATAYRSFLYPFLTNSDSFFSDYYLERLMPDQELADFDDDALKETLKQLNRSHGQISPSLMPHTTVSPTLEQWCQPVLFPALGIEAQTGTRIVTESGIFEPAGVIALPEQAVQAEYQGKAARRDLACLVWVLPWRSSNLDAIPAEQEQLSEEDSPFAGLTYMEIAQRSLLASDVPWGIVTNGRKLRLLSKGTAHKPRAFVEMDLEAVIQQRGTQEGKLAFRYLLGLFAGESFTVLDDKDRTRLDRVLQESDRHGQEISDELKQNVFRALEELGDGFLEYMKARPDEVTAFSAEYILEPTPSDALLTEVYQESMSLMYRLLFLFYAESRDMLPMEDELYRETYSLEAIRDEIISVVDDPDPTQFFGKGSLALWGRLQELFALVEQGGLGNRIPAYDGGLFDPENHPFLVTFAVGDYYLARAIDLLSRTRPSKNRPRGEGRKKVTYRDLDVRHLGSIYEGILEYSAHIATEELAIMQRGAGGKKYEEYVGVSELKPDERVQLAKYKAALAEDPENPPLLNRCKVAGVKEPGQYFLVFGGRESKRKSSGSYYTPDYIVQYIVENTLGPLVRGENREGDLHNKLLTAEEILELKVLDPAMGSGHFLVAATEFLARAYGEALIRAGRDDDGVMSEEEFIRYKRIVAERCIYGVDINPMAVELAKLSMWLFTMDRNRPLSFLNHHFRCGNALIGAWIKELGELPSSTNQTDDAQINLFEQRIRERVPIMMQDLLKIMNEETETVEDIELKKVSDQTVEHIKEPFRKLSNSWLSAFFGEPAVDYYAFLMEIKKATNINDSFGIAKGFYSWEIEFPEVFFNLDGTWQDNPGFDAVIGNPPWGANFDDQELAFHRFRHRSIIVRMIDSFMYFFHYSCKYLAKDYTSMIIPDVILYQGDNQKLRSFLFREFEIERIINLGTVFDGVTRPSAILIVRRGRNRPWPLGTKSLVSDAGNISKEQKKDYIANHKNYKDIDHDFFRSLPGLILPTSNIEKYEILVKIQQENHLKLSSVIDSDGIQRGVSPDLKDAFIVDSGTKKVFQLEESHLRRVVTGGSQVKPYYIDLEDLWLIYTSREDNFDRIPNICSYIDQFKSQIKCREVAQHKHPLYSLHRPRNKQIFEKDKKFLGVITGDKIIASLDSEKVYATDGLYIFGIKQDIDPMLLLGILNSKLFTFLYRLTTLEEGRVLAQVKPTILESVPLPDLAQETRKGREECSSIISSVKRILDIHQEYKGNSKKSSENMKPWQSQIDASVFSLYNLSREDYFIVENTVLK